jgi:hypothetical protein
MEYRFLKVNYESIVDFRCATDYLRCNPEFYGKPRYDCIAINTANGYIFAQLIFMFSCEVDRKKYPIALVQPFDAPIPNRSRKDKDLGLCRVRERPCAQSEFVLVSTIVRGALLAEDPENVGDWFVVDLVDTDMFLRLKKIFNV